MPSYSLNGRYGGRWRRLKWTPVFVVPTDLKLLVLTLGFTFVPTLCGRLNIGGQQHSPSRDYHSTFDLSNKVLEGTLTAEPTRLCKHTKTQQMEQIADSYVEARPLGTAEVHGMNISSLLAVD